MADNMQNSVPNEDKNDTSTPYSSEDAAANSTSDVGSPNEADVDSALDADSPSEVGTSSASNSTPNSVSNSAPDSTPESTSDNIPDADSSTFQHPHRKRNIAIGVIIAVVVVAAIVIILAFAHPWDAGDNNDTASDESNSSHQEIQQQQQEDSSNESLGENKSGDGNENNPNSAGNESNLEDEDVSEGVSNNANNANNAQDNNSTNQFDSSDGIINRDDYDTEEEYMAAWIAAGTPETQIEKETVPTTKNGSEGYYKGILIIHFYYDLCDEDRAREIISDLGGIWISTTYGRGSSTSLGDFDVEAYFPDAPYEDELKAISEKLNAMPEVSSAYMDSYCSLD